jgi:hypothetical protein
MWTRFSRKPKKLFRLLLKRSAILGGMTWQDTAQGALEVWTCNLEGEMQFYSAKQSLAQSQLVANFPQQLEMLS